MQPYSEQRNSVVGHQQLSTEGKYPANTWQYRSNTEDHVTHVAQTQSKRQTRHVGAYLVGWERQLKKQKPKLSLTFAYDTDPGVLVCTKKPIVVESKVTFFFFNMLRNRQGDTDAGIMWERKEKSAAHNRQINQLLIFIWTTNSLVVIDGTATVAY